MAWWETASHYHLIHSVLLVVVSFWAIQPHAPTTPLKVSSIALVVGMLIFSGTLYCMTLTGIRWLGAITPLGGTSLLVAWASLAWAGWLSR